MQEFIAEKPDLNLNLTTLSGEKLTLEPNVPISGKGVLAITKKWTDLENKQEQKKTTPVEIVSIELSYVYPKSSEWFLENFDFPTLGEILLHVAQTFGGSKKK